MYLNDNATAPPDQDREHADGTSILASASNNDTGAPRAVHDDDVNDPDYAEWEKLYDQFCDTLTRDTSLDEILKREIVARWGLPIYFNSWVPKLKPPGSNGWATGRCPFHDDAHPSFRVNLHHGGWICHAGCGKGSLFDFYRKKEGKEADPFRLRSCKESRV